MSTEPVYDFDAMFTSMRYPAGESHISARNYIPKNPVILHPYCRTFEDICNIRVANNILKMNGEPNATWFVPYFPFARHDRRNFKGDGLELTVAMKILEGINVITLDPHSDVLGVMPHIPQSEVVKAIDEEFKIWDQNPIVVIPDAGAAKKAYSWVGNSEVAQASKVRDTSTGKLSGFKVDRENFNGRPCLVVDDICDAGGTFLGLADLLKAKNAGPLTLIVTHGLFTKGTSDLLSKYAEIIVASKANSKGSRVLSEHRISSISYAKLYQRGIFQ